MRQCHISSRTVNIIDQQSLLSIQQAGGLAARRDWQRADGAVSNHCSVNNCSADLAVACCWLMTDSLQAVFGLVAQTLVRRRKEESKLQ